MFGFPSTMNDEHLNHNSSEKTDDNVQLLVFQKLSEELVTEITSKVFGHFDSEYINDDFKTDSLAFGCHETNGQAKNRSRTCCSTTYALDDTFLAKIFNQEPSKQPKLKGKPVSKAPRTEKQRHKLRKKMLLKKKIKEIGTDFQVIKPRCAF